MHRIRGRLTYANVVATLALFIALAGGTAFAATQVLPKNSVGTKQIQKEAVTPAKLSKGAKTALAGDKGATGAVGPQGPKGDTGPPGLGNTFYTSNNDEALHAKTISLNVPPGNYVVTASMFAFNRESKEGRVGCDLVSPNDPSHEGSAVANVPKEPTETIVSYQQPEAQAVFALGGGGTIRFECENVEGTAKVGFYQAQIIASAVGSLSG